MTVRPLLLLAFVHLLAGCASRHAAPTSAPYDYAAEEPPAPVPVDASASGETATAIAGPTSAASSSDVAAVVEREAPTAVLAAPAVAASSKSNVAPPDEDHEDAIDGLIVFTGTLTLLVEGGTTAATTEAAIERAVAAGGYVAQQSDTTVQLRVPSRRFRSVMKGLGELGEVQTRSVTSLDVSEEFHDLQVRLANLKATRERIGKLMASAKDLAEVLTIEKELERVTAEIDRIEGRLRVLATQVAFSTITLSISERATVVEAPIEVPQALPVPARTLPSSVKWIERVDVHRLMTLD
jgi:hypothetical protein